MSFPEHMGLNFTTPIHAKPAGPTLPENNKVDTPFVVVVTGAGKGLGYYISLAYARAGVSGICISSRTQSDLDALEKDLRAVNPGIDILSVLCDTSRPEDVAALAAATKSRFGGRLDVVVANAGIISKYLHDQDPATGEQTNRRLPVGIVEDDDFARVIAINLLGSYYAAKYFAPLLLDKAANPSVVRAFVVITSLASHIQSSQFTPVAYNVSKIANNRMAEHMQNDHGAAGLQAFAVHPGAVLTPQTQLHSTAEGDAWEKLLVDDIELCGGFLTWLTRERREWLGGRYISVNWDVADLERQKDEIVAKDKLKFTMDI